MITVLTLPECSYCKALVSGLQDRGIRCTIRDADTCSDYCDAVETLIDTNRYPILIQEEATTTYYCLAKLNETRTLADGSKVEECRGVDTILHLISNT